MSDESLLRFALPFISIDTSEAEFCGVTSNLIEKPNSGGYDTNEILKIPGVSQNQPLNGTIPCDVVSKKTEINNEFFVLCPVLCTTSDGVLPMLSSSSVHDQSLGPYPIADCPPACTYIENSSLVSTSDSLMSLTTGEETDKLGVLPDQTADLLWPSPPFCHTVFGEIGEPLPSLLSLPLTNSQCSLEEEKPPLDALLSMHPLFTTLHDLLQCGNFCGSNVASSVSEDHSSLTTNCVVMSEADVIMHQALTLVKTTLKHDQDTVTLLHKIDHDCATLSEETASFCSKLLETEDSDTVIPDTSDSGAENSLNVPNLLTPEVNEKQQKKENQRDLPAETHVSDMPKQCSYLSQPSSKVNKKEMKKRTHISNRSTAVLRQWLFEHASHPYPNDDEKDELCLRTDLTAAQLNNWFINARRRVLQPYLNQQKYPLMK